ncbi:unnamed protein product [Protopolystoma xenopodis]|uniref:Uncharacterized protein n=1 Tax=Protopolystoma xenopodis TaxID=117903 RepID=A0A3S5BW83_9PLAT|nr:unnamed protein product [Protopolystoma xenopodis]
MVIAVAMFEGSELKSHPSVLYITTIDVPRLAFPAEKKGKPSLQLHIHTKIYVRMQTHIHVRLYMCSYFCVFVHLCSANTSMGVRLYIYIYIYAYLYLCINILIQSYEQNTGERRDVLRSCKGENGGDLCPQTATELSA